MDDPAPPAPEWPRDGVAFDRDELVVEVGYLHGVEGLGSPRVIETTTSYFHEPYIPDECVTVRSGAAAIAILGVMLWRRAT
jgi:hypothetical protein